MRLRLGTRQSPLAQWQAETVAATLRQISGVDVEIVFVKTLGDECRDKPIPDIGAPGVFTKRLQDALLSGEVDLAVHSLKDLPTDAVPGLTLEAVLSRGAVGDAFLSHRAASLETLPAGSVIGTGSVRRQCQIRHSFGDKFILRDIRGNVETRLQKLDAQNEYDAIILAEAGLERLGFQDRITQRLPLSLILPAVGQGAIGIEIRNDDAETANHVAILDDAATHAATHAERAMLARLQGGCIAPIAGYARIENDTLTLTGRLLSADGATMRESTQSTNLLQHAEELGIAVADEIIC